MTRLGFYLARTLRSEAALATLGLPMAAVLNQLHGHLALVGNAQSLSATAQGAAIDAADLVIRLNRAPMPEARSHGTRTDVLACATSLSAAQLHHLNPKLLLWMSPKRKRLSWAMARRQGFALPPLDTYVRLKAHLNAPPTTGLMMIDLLSHSPATKITLYGFDFFTSLSLSGRRTAAQVPHNFQAERAFVSALLARDPRFCLANPSALTE
jgi:hypothetical protein